MKGKTKAGHDVGASKPKPDRPTMPQGYGIAKDSKGVLDWPKVEQRLGKARNYWVATARPDGRPHAMPVWGLWLEGRFYFSSDGGSRKGKNIAAMPYAVVHLESGDDVVILEGAAERVREKELFSRVDKLYQRKYGMGFSGIPGDVALFAVAPQVVFAWREKDFPKSATRWRLGKSGDRVIEPSGD